MSDPLFAHGVGLAVILIVLVKVVVAFAALLVCTMLMVWFERKVISDMQNRIGPNRAGPYGLLQSLADGTKLFFKEDLLPEKADRFVFRLAPLLAVIPAFLIFAVVPVGGVVTIAHHVVELQVADPPMGILYLLALSSVAVYGVMLAGWSSGSKYPLLGSVRASAQMISYEAALGLTVVTVVLESHSLSTRAIIQSQSHHFWQWNVLRLGIVPFAIFMIASTAEMNRPPFDLAEGESELGGGFNTEYSSLRFALFYLAEFMNTITMSAVAVTLFFGGPDGPGFHVVRWLWPILWFLGKTVAFCYVQVWIRASLPRMRYDQLMDLGWKRLIPLSLGWLLVVAGFIVSVAWGAALFGAGVLAAVLLYQSIRVGRRRRESLAAAMAAAAVPRPRPGGNRQGPVDLRPLAGTGKVGT
ncbi:MAG: dehydrogenase (quinone) [Acidimicrobiaceae bacterium]|jgi:NADH-quinone oxidoreductase subunit H|nr:dehydrogenase (quinone) [Acidimicrobiaceae bacterium]